MTSSPPQPQPGQGRIHCTAYGSKAIFKCLSAKYPLKFLSSQSHRDRVAIAYMLSYGGGMLSDDRVIVDVDVDDNATLMLLTQGSTKIYKNKLQQQSIAGTATSQEPTAADRGAFQTLNVRVSPLATFLLLPDPVTCFRASSYTQKQTFHVASVDTGTLVVLDWYTSGRLLHGETWAFHKYASRNDVYVAGKLVIRDSTLLEDENRTSPVNSTGNSPTSYVARLGPYTCFATLILLGASLADAVAAILVRFDEVSLQRTTRPRELMWTVSPVCRGGGVLVRVAGMETEAVRGFLKEGCLRGGLERLLGDTFERVI
ncbi:UreD urease accessory protein-domain-containing protein [Jimgerdemannia flammicorona]|uniref:UreD urease accessory protein-domain-containing protein n=1 Tax=Jimgerdemannia flammicorona TaxID=994334 RepID=A0A433CZ57_9FUNG|nr:UreD urease accessory protein-domain-containing protein [Jimgerdemannia flammicorona]